VGRISESFDFGRAEDLDKETLLRYLEEMYSTLAEAVNRKPDIYQRTTDGQTTDTFLSNGDININTTTLKVEMLTEHTNPTTVNWTQLS